MKKIILILSTIFVFNAVALDEIISVNGKCSKELVNDRGAITLKVVSKDKEANRAIAETNRKYNQLSRAIKNLKLKNMKLDNTAYRVDQDYKWEKGKRTFLGHKATIALRIETSDIKRIGEVIKAAQNNKVDNIGSLSMFLSDKLKDKTYVTCLEIAAKDAKAKAQTMAKALGVKVGKAVNIQESRHIQPIPPTPVPYLRSKGAMMAEASAPPAIESGTNKVSVTINISFEIK